MTGRERVEGDHRFTLTVAGPDEQGVWTATVYDLADHGADLPYATITAGSLDKALDSASHYMLMAEPEPFQARLREEVI